MAQASAQGPRCRERRALQAVQRLVADHIGAANRRVPSAAPIHDLARPQPTAIRCCKAETRSALETSKPGAGAPHTRVREASTTRSGVSQATGPRNNVWEAPCVRQGGAIYADARNRRNLLRLSNGLFVTLSETSGITRDRGQPVVSRRPARTSGPGVPASHTSLSTCSFKGRRTWRRTSTSSSCSALAEHLTVPHGSSGRTTTRPSPRTSWLPRCGSKPTAWDNCSRR